MICDHACKSTPASAQQWEERIVVAQTKGMEALVEPTIGRWFPAEILAKNPPYIDKVRGMIRNTPANGFIGCSAALADHDYNSMVETVKCPVIFIVGEKDGTAPVAMKDMHNRLKGSTYVELKGAGHISNLDCSAEFTKAIQDFVA
jgi:3-oxoadipate enol-lactonase